jgi:hypothetical protein
MTVVLWSSMTAVVMISAAFGLIFSERLMMTATASRDLYRFALIDAAALTLLLAVGRLDHVAAAFARRMSAANWDPHATGGQAIRRKAVHAYQAALVRTASVYTAIVASVAATGFALGIVDGSRGLIPLIGPFASGLLLMLALATVRLLEGVRKPAAALVSVGVGLVITFVAALVASSFNLPAGSAMGLGAAATLIGSTLAMRRVLRCPEGALFVA